MHEFEARAVAAVELVDLNTFVIVLAEDADGSGQTLELQLALDFDDQDEARGEGTYCLVVDGSRTHYGGVGGYELSGDALTISLDEHAQAQLEVDSGFHIRIAVDPSSLEALRAGVVRILGPSQPEAG